MFNTTCIRDSCNRTDFDRYMLQQLNTKNIPDYLDSSNLNNYKCNQNVRGSDNPLNKGLTSFGRYVLPSSNCPVPSNKISTNLMRNVINPRVGYQPPNVNINASWIPIINNN